MEEGSIRKRSAVPEEFTWNLRDIFESDEAWLREYEELKKLPPKYAAFQGRLGESAEQLLGFLRLDDEVAVRLGMLVSYANMKSDQDTANSFYQDMRGKAVSCHVLVSGASAFAAPEIMDISDSKLDAFYACCPQLETYRRALYRLRRRREHILTPPEEKLLADAGEMADSPDAIGSIFRSADLKFPDAVDSHGRPHCLTAETLVPLLESDDRGLRRSAFENYYDTLGQYENTMAATLDAQFKQLCFFANARRYQSTLEASLDATEVPCLVYTRLIESVHANLDKMYRYVSLRKRMLGVEKLHMYDVYTPVVADAAEKISYDEAKETVLKALSVLGEDYVAILRRGFEERWIDVYENTGKRSGAYSWGCYNAHPYVLLNYQSKYNDVSTLAHEMGHAMHRYYSNNHEDYYYSDNAIFVAEIASTVNETLLNLYMIDNTNDVGEKKSIINEMLDDIKNTIYRQTMFAEFELDIHNRCFNGESLSADALNEMYLNLIKKYHGKDVVYDDYIKYEWSRIPHFYSPFYVYQYATGLSIAWIIASRIYSGDKSMRKLYLEFLSSGSNDYPTNLVEKMGINITDSVNEAMRRFDKLMDDYKNI